MKLEQQVISLDLAKRLKELGVTQESYFWWTQKNLLVSTSDAIQGYANETGTPLYSAFTVAELGEMLPAELKGGWLLQMAPAFKNIEAWVLWYEDSESPEKMMLNGNHWTISAKTEAEARGLMLEYLITNKLLGV